MNRLSLVATLAVFLGACLVPLAAQTPAPGAPTAAQTAPAADAAPAAPAQGVKELSLAQMFILGGWTMYPLAACSVAALALILYNVLFLRKMVPKDVMGDIQNALAALDVEAARQLCTTHPCLSSNIILAGLDRIRDGELSVSSVEKGLEEAAVEEIGHNLLPINYLSTIAVIAPMLGLLGTVSGMIKAFRAMALGGMGRPEVLADNISEALITTAAGLIVGIPVMVAFFYFKNEYTSKVATLNRILGALVDTLTAAVRRAQQTASY